jgi:putative resolvase
MRFDRKGFLKLLSEIESDRVIYITHRDRLARFKYDLIEKVCEMHGEEIMTANQELSRDPISIITSFSAPLYANKTRKIPFREPLDNSKVETLYANKTRKILEAVKS